MNIKVRCQCPKPPISFHKGVVPVIHFDGVPEGTLHFKAADRQCDHCGKPICKDCTVNLWREYPFPWNWKGIHYVCSDCHEIFYKPEKELVERI